MLKINLLLVTYMEIKVFTIYTIYITCNFFFQAFIYSPKMYFREKLFLLLKYYKISI
jgi:hypothetical protein